MLENIEKALHQSSHCEQPIKHDGPVLLEQNFPSIEEQSLHWTLNKKQHYAFSLMGAALLKHIFLCNSGNESQQSQHIVSIISKIEQHLDVLLPESKQLIMFLSGSGGTGKSRVIKPFTDFARRWYSEASVVVTATSGIVAMLILGCTLHTALGVPIGFNHPKPRPEHIVAWSEVGLLIVDEIGMIAPGFLHATDKRLKELKNRPSLPFGGVHMVFSGDFYQIPPPRSPSVYYTAEDKASHSIPTASVAKKKTKQSKVSMPHTFGKLLWRECLTDVIELTENHRQADRLWALILERFRINQPTKSDLQLINSRFMFKTSRLQSHRHHSRLQQCSPTIKEKARFISVRINF